MAVRHPRQLGGEWWVKGTATAGVPWTDRRNEGWPRGQHSLEPPGATGQLRLEPGSSSQRGDVGGRNRWSPMDRPGSFGWSPGARPRGRRCCEPCEAQDNLMKEGWPRGQHSLEPPGATGQPPLEPGSSSQGGDVDAPVAVRYPGQLGGKGRVSGPATAGVPRTDRAASAGARVHGTPKLRATLEHNFQRRTRVAQGCRRWRVRSGLGGSYRWSPTDRPGSFGWSPGARVT